MHVATLILFNYVSVVLNVCLRSHALLLRIHESIRKLSRQALTFYFLSLNNNLYAHKETAQLVKTTGFCFSVNLWIVILLLVLLMHKDFECLRPTVMRHTALPALFLGCIFLAQTKLFMPVLFPMAKARNRKESFHLIDPYLTGLLWDLIN